MTTRHLLDLPVNYRNSETLAPLPNIAPSSRPNVLSIHNFCFNKQGTYQRNRFIKMVLSLNHPKLASAVMTLQGDQAATELLKGLFSRQHNVWLQAFHYNILLLATNCYDLSRGRKFYRNKEDDVFLPSNIASVQFEHKIYMTRQVAWSRVDFEHNFRSRKVSAPLRDMDNLHIQELQFIKTTLASPRPNLY